MKTISAIIYAVFCLSLVLMTGGVVVASQQSLLIDDAAAKTSLLKCPAEKLLKSTFVIKATEPFIVKLPPMTKMIVQSADARRWSHDPLASIQNLMVNTKVRLGIAVDGNTLTDIEWLIADKKILVRADALRAVMAEVSEEVNSALEKNGVASVHSFDSKFPWVSSEIWKKYLLLRNKTEGLDLSFIGACGEKTYDFTDSVAEKASADSVFLGDFPGIGLRVGSLIATMDGNEPVAFCKGGDSLENYTNFPVDVRIEINDNQPKDNSGEVSLVVGFTKSVNVFK